jgi:hypothetical protein
MTNPLLRNALREHQLADSSMKKWISDTPQIKQVFIEFKSVIDVRQLFTGRPRSTSSSNCSAMRRNALREYMGDEVQYRIKKLALQVLVLDQVTTLPISSFVDFTQRTSVYFIGDLVFHKSVTSSIHRFLHQFILEQVPS